MVGDSDKLQTLSLFSGIGGIELGLRRWCRTVCYCEIDPYAVGVLVKNMAQGNLDVAPVWSDVTTFGRTEIEAVGPIECITGGFPCQDISCAGKGAGIVKGETRSGLFYEIIRIVRLVRPQYVFLENVPALLVQGMDTVCRELAESWYDEKWMCLSAADVGANHRRLRWWSLAYPNIISNKRWADERDKADGSRPCNISSRSSDNAGNVAHPQHLRELQPQGSVENEREWTSNDRQNVADTEELRRSEGDKNVGRSGQGTGEKKEWVRPTECSWWATEPDVGRVAHGVPFRVDRLRCLGNAVVPQCAEKAFELLMEL